MLTDDDLHNIQEEFLLKNKDTLFKMFVLAYYNCALDNFSAETLATNIILTAFMQHLIDRFGVAELERFVEGGSLNLVDSDLDWLNNISKGL